MLSNQVQFALERVSFKPFVRSDKDLFHCWHRCSSCVADIGLIWLYGEFSPPDKALTGFYDGRFKNLLAKRSLLRITWQEYDTSAKCAVLG